ncbi:cupin domain-containing protein [uncultured Cohaesibacter sp.]|uniref:cupin domain-containing protein n=1 Tax=uncultured Cohaesibacter sp. TaxID=1002546 RepID=UPI00292FE169|nr:cupin domain-containing protein [uncultured Cohaesibacter sp.]
MSPTSTSDPVKVKAIIDALGMEPHPEGGHFVETFRDTRSSDGRACSTVIYFLLEAGEVSHWHRVDAVEAWFWQAGAPLQLSISDGDGTISHTRLGPDILSGEHPHGIVPCMAWQSAKSLGAWTLVSCMVAPGFRFEGFELAPEDWAPEDWAPDA